MSKVIYFPLSVYVENFVFSAMYIFIDFFNSIQKAGNLMMKKIEISF